MKRYLVIACSVLVVLAFLIACGPSPTPTPSPSPSAKPSPTSSPSPSASPSPTPKPTPAGPKYGGQLRYWSVVVPAFWDMHRKPSYGPVFGMPVFNNLVQFDLTKKELNSSTVMGDLADRWEVSPDGKLFTFFLRKGVKWHDGSPFSADDVVYSMEKMVDPKRSTMTTDFEALDRVEKVDDFTVKMYLKAPSPSFLVMLAGAYANIQSKAKANVDYRTTDFLMGTGPFKFKTYTSGVSVEYVKNPDYFKKDKNGNPMPYLDGLLVNIIADRSAALDAFVTKRVDMSSPLTVVAAQNELDRLKQQAPEIVVTPYNPPGAGLSWLNPQTKQLQDKRVRQALVLARDLNTLGIATYGSEFFVDLNRAILSPGWGLSRPEFEKLLGTDRPMDARVADAKKLMADAGYANGFKYRMLQRTAPESQRSSQALQDMYRRYINLDAEIMLRELNEARKMRDEGQFDQYSDNPLTVVGDPDEVKSYFVTGGGENFTKYSNPEVDKLFEAQGKEMDVAKRKQLTRQIETILLSDGWVIHGAYNVYSLAWWPYVKDMYPHPIIHSNKSRMEQVWLDK